MTREEAICKMKIAVPMQAGVSEQNYTNFIDCLAAVGVLNLDEPESEPALRDIIAKSFEGTYSNYQSADDAILKIYEAGWRIVRDDRLE